MTKAGSRELILDILFEILERGGYSHVVLGQALEKYQYLEKQERAFITRVVEGTLEYRMTIDLVLDECSGVPVRKMKPMIRTLLRMSVYQLLWMDRVPDSAVCNEAVKLAAARHFQGLKGYVNGVLRRIAREKERFVPAEEAGEQPDSGQERFLPGDWSYRYSMPAWLIALWKGQYPASQVENMLKAFLAQRPVTVRCNPGLAFVEEIVESLESQQVRVTPCPLGKGMLCLENLDYLEKLDAFRRGWIQVQDASSGLVGLAADPRPGDVVLDVCGAPGGKGLHVAELLGGTGLVVIRDISEAKIRLVRENLERAGRTEEARPGVHGRQPGEARPGVYGRQPGAAPAYGNVRTEVWDAREPDPAWYGKADIVIADLPCSGLGVIGRKPEIKYQASPEQIRDLAALQRQILTVASQYVKPGGKLVYSTCTISPEENERQRQWILASLPFSGVNIRGLLGEGVEEETLQEGYVQLLPGTYPCDGFFIAVFQRTDQ